MGGSLRQAASLVGVIFYSFFFFFFWFGFVFLIAKFLGLTPFAFFLSVTQVEGI